MKRITLLLLLVCCIGLQGFATKIKVACIGNSITAGIAASDRAAKGYVGVLTEMMGEECYPKNDKLHPNDLGHRVIAETIYQVVAAKR